MALDISPGDYIADIGSGGGYFTFLLAEAVGPEGKVFATDIDQKMVRYIEEKAKERGLMNVEPILAEPHDPLLPDASIDLVFISNTYHHLSDRTDYFVEVKKYLKPVIPMNLVQK